MKMAEFLTEERGKELYGSKGKTNAALVVRAIV